MEQPGTTLAGADPRLAGLADEAIWLARLTVQLAPDQPEALGLLSQILHCAARRAARRAPDGAFIPLRDQDAALWFREMMAEAEAALHAAARMARPGRFQTEAAIQSLHAQGRSSGEQLQRPLAQPYDLLARFAPTTGVLVARAVALAESGEVDAALSQLEAITDAEAYQHGGRPAPALSGSAAMRSPPVWPLRARPVSAAIPGIRQFLLQGGYRGRPHQDIRRRGG